MLTKIANCTLIDVQPLNKPISLADDKSLPDINLAGYFKLQKLASKSAERHIDGDGASDFDLEAEIKNHPDSLFVKCFAIKANEMNDNGDYFERTELRKAVATFVGVPIFTNHNNQDINQARGKVVHSWWDDDRDGIMIIGRVDAAAYPPLARGIKEKYIFSTSMGASVKYSICSVCHNVAEKPEEYCSCIKDRKTRHVTAKKQKCQYFKNGIDSQCPHCGSTKNNIREFDYEGRAFEYNYGIKFIENSFVTTPACHSCGVTEVIDPQTFLSKVAEISERLPRLIAAFNDGSMFCNKSHIKLASFEHGMNLLAQAMLDQVTTIGNQLPSMIKVASEQDVLCTETQCVKLAGQKEVGELNQALDLLTSVSQAMLKQKEQIDLEFLSDLVKVLADLQGVTDELTEQGYGRLQSPDGSTPDTQQTTQPESQVTHTVQPQPTANPGAAKIHTGPAGVGTVTAPTASSIGIQLEKLAAMEPKNNTLLLELKMESPNSDRKLYIPFRM